jgi:hypothetical protein
MGRFVHHQNNRTNNPLSEEKLRHPSADRDVLVDVSDHNHHAAYTDTNAGFRPGPQVQQTHSPVGDSGHKLSYLKAEIDFMVDGFMRELIDFDALSNLDPQIQQEITSRYPQFFS